MLSSARARQCTAVAKQCSGEAGLPWAVHWQRTAVNGTGKALLDRAVLRRSMAMRGQGGPGPGAARHRQRNARQCDEQERVRSRPKDRDRDAWLRVQNHSPGPETGVYDSSVMDPKLVFTVAQLEDQLARLLADGPLPSSDVLSFLGCSRATLWRIRRRLGIVAFQHGRRWWMALPEC